MIADVQRSGERMGEWMDERTAAAAKERRRERTRLVGLIGDAKRSVSLEG